MTIYDIEWKSSAVKEIKRLDRPIISRIIKAVESLSSNPFPSGVRKLKGGEYSYRIRVGDYRVVYTAFKDPLTLEIVRVRHRKDVYRI